MESIFRSLTLLGLLLVTFSSDGVSGSEDDNEFEAVRRKIDTIRSIIIAVVAVATVVVGVPIAICICMGACCFNRRRVTLPLTTIPAYAGNSAGFVTQGNTTMAIYTTQSYSGFHGSFGAPACPVQQTYHDDFPSKGAAPMPQELQDPPPPYSEVRPSCSRQFNQMQP